MQKICKNSTKRSNHKTANKIKTQKYTHNGYKRERKPNP